MKLQVLATILATVLGALSSASGATLFEETIAVQGPHGPAGLRGWMGDFLVRKDDILWMAFTQDRAIKAVASSDQGKTWGQPFTLVAKPGHDESFCHPGFLRLANGDILLSYIYVVNAALPYCIHNYYRRSTDDGRTWTEQFIMTPRPGCAEVHNDRLQLLSTGRILAPAAYKAHYPSTQDHNGYVGMSFFSDDQGYSWLASTNTVDMQPVEVQEADAVELKDGRIMMFARSYSGHPVRAYSSDRGETWSEGEMIQELNQPYAGFPTVRRIPSTGDLLFFWCGESSPGPPVLRTAIACAVSTDEGRTFLHRRNLVRDPTGDFGYQCVEFLGNDLAVVGYHTIDSIRVARIGIDWFYGK